MKLYSEEELAVQCGGEGKKTFVAVDGKVYDISESAKWKNGLHMNRHKAGQDLSTDIAAAPHGAEVLERFEVVGSLAQETRPDPDSLKGKVDAWLDRHPFFRRHPHPALVHFPLALFLMVPLLHILGLIAGSSKTEWAAACCLAVGTLSLVPVMLSGYLTWWINYDCLNSDLIRTKRRLAWTTCILALVAVGLRLAIGFQFPPEGVMGAAYLISVLMLAGVVSAVGFLGGKLIFPYH